MTDTPLDLGSGFFLRFTAWAPDRTIRENRVRYAFVPDVDKIGAILTCRHGIEGSILFSISPEHDKIFENQPHWTVNSWEPLDISPSVACGSCGCHGFIREGKWVDA